MKYAILFILLIISQITFAQKDSILSKFDSRKNAINHKGMAVLTAWSGATIAGSAVGYGLTTSYEEQQFYIMNGAWGIINLGIALPGLLSKPKRTASVYELQKSQTKLEKLFLANALLDVVYISGGCILKQYAAEQTNDRKYQQFNGFGNAVILQGAGLLIFDTAMTLIHNNHRKNKLDPFLKNGTLSFTGTSLRLGYRFN
jgi:MFS family permease